MLPLRLDGVDSVLCLGAHADDIEVGCGGTILRLLAERPQIVVHWLVLSAQGSRAEEAAAGAEAFLGKGRTEGVVLQSFRDSFFPFQGAEIKEYLHALALEISPDAIFTHHSGDLHQDHRLVSDLTRYAFRDRLILEYEIPKFDGDLGQPNLFVPVDEATCRRKVRTIFETFRTQRDKSWFTEDTFWSMLRIRGVECNSPSRFAEAFHCRKMVAAF